MKKIKKVKVIPALKARTQFGEIINRASYAQDRFIVTRGGKPAVVIIGVEDYQNLLEIVDEQLDPEFQAGLKEAWEDFQAGRTCTIDDLYQDLEQDRKNAGKASKKL